MIMLTGLDDDPGEDRPASALLRRFQLAGEAGETADQAARMALSTRLGSLEASLGCSLEVCDADALIGRLVVTRNEATAPRAFALACDGVPVDIWSSVARLPFEVSARQLLLVAGLGERSGSGGHREACIAAIRAIRESVPRVYAQFTAWAPVGTSGEPS